MAEFVHLPNLPSKAKVVIIGEKYSKALDKAVKKCGIFPLYVPDNPHVDPRLSGHADLSVFHAGGKTVCLAPYLRGTAFAAQLESFGVSLHYADIAQSLKYPDDAQLNIAAVGKHLIYGKKTAYKRVVDCLTNGRGFYGVPVKQGYSKCSVLPIDEHSIITQDRGIAAAAMAAGLDVLLIGNGFVSLDGFEYGFLGGAGFKLSTDALAFTGTLDAHPDKARILDFLEERGVHAVYLTGLPVFDIGSAIQIIENIERH